MEIFIDSANVEEIRNWLEYGVIDGVTTNPSIMLKDNVYDLQGGAREIAALVSPRPVSVEVVTNDRQEMLVQAGELAGWASNIVIKIPIINEQGEPCLDVIGQLEREGIRVNVTACMSFGQAVLAAKVGATYISLFGGRIADEGRDAADVIRKTRQWLDLWNYESKIIVGSIRTVMDIQTAALAGAHVITIPPQFLPKMVDHKYTRYTVGQFMRDAQEAMARMKQRGEVDDA